MTEEKFRAMFAKDYLTIQDFMNLLGMSYCAASRKMCEIKFKHDRLHIRGRLHIQDYFDYYGITDTSRYYGGK